jgi:hypothetical protein
MPNEEKCSSTNPAFSGTARYRGYSRGAAAGELLRIGFYRPGHLTLKRAV